MAFRSRLAHTSSLFALVTAFLAVVSTTGCHFTPVSDPNDPLHGVRGFAVEPVGFINLQIGRKPEPVYLGEKDEKQQQSWQTDKAELSRILGEHLGQVVTPAGIILAPPSPENPGPVLVRLNINFIEPGVYTFFVNIATEVRMTVEIISPQGQILGQETFAVAIPATMGNPSSGERMRQAGERLGNRLGHYLLRRTGLGY